jgi:hypothetical protein
MRKRVNFIVLKLLKLFANFAPSGGKGTHSNGKIGMALELDKHIYIILIELILNSNIHTA